jgi:phage terminase small subunit
MDDVFEKLTEKQKIFCREYIVDWNATQAAIKAGYSEKTSGAIGWENLRKPEIQAYIEHIQKDLEKIAGISRLKVIQEHQKLAFSSIAHLHDTWMTRKEFEKLTTEQKDSISEISTQLKTTRNEDGSLSENEYVKVKLFDKQKSLDSISKMLGYNEPDRLAVETKDAKFIKLPDGTEISL